MNANKQDAGGEVTNRDNVGGLLPCPFCGGAAERIDFGPGSGDNEGGSCIACTKCQASGPVEFGYKENFVSNWNRRELCRAAPAGGDDWPFLEEIGRDGKPTGYWIRKGSPAAARMSAPAGSVEVEALASRLVSMSNGLHSAHLCTDLRRAAALLRKLQQGADGWRPIESAPKDGSLFLCWVDAVRYGERDDGSFDTADCSDVDFCQWRGSEHGGYFMNMMGDIGDGQNITHWRPLPTRPASQGQEGSK